MEKRDISKLDIKELIRHFYYSHETLIITEGTKIKGAITYNSFIAGNNINQMLRKVIIIKDPSEIEIGDLVNVYCLQKGDSFEEITKTVDPRYDFTIERFKALYNDNDIISNYLKSLNLDTIYVTGVQKEYVYNSIKMYGLNADVVIVEDKDVPGLLNNPGDNKIIIDTTSFSTELLNKINNIKELNYRILNLKELSRYAEIYHFVNTTSKREDVKSIVFQFPDINELINLTPEEKERIVFDHYYKYYFDAYLKHGEYKELLQKVFKEFFTREFIESRYTMPKVFSKGGVLYLEDSNNPYCHSINGMRITTDQDKEYAANLNIFGACIVYSAMTDDKHTLPSYIQRLINEGNCSYRVNNYGARAIDFSENLRTSRDINLYRNDLNVFVVSGEEARILKSMGYEGVHSLTPVINNPKLKDYFIDEPVHCNHEANELMAVHMYKVIEKDLKEDLKKEKRELISKPAKKNIFKDNKILKEYLQFLEPYSHFSGKKGCIVMNCNPFTYGHYRLIDYARKQVDKLIVLVVQEDKSYFKFNDRYQMVVDGCRELDNVVVLPSGELLASALLFPEYFNKDDNPDVAIDASKDIALFCNYLAPYLGIKIRFVGEEKVDKVTRAYNINLKETLPLYGIEIIEIPRYEDPNGNAISAKLVRKNYEAENWEELKDQIPETTIKRLKLIKDRGKKNEF